jgi:hypothetical protein
MPINIIFNRTFVGNGSISWLPVLAGFQYFSIHHFFVAQPGTSSYSRRSSLRSWSLPSSSTFRNCSRRLALPLCPWFTISCRWHSEWGYYSWMKLASGLCERIPRVSWRRRLGEAGLIPRWEARFDVKAVYSQFS